MGHPSGRFQCFGHLFAATPDGTGHRLDRHPVMARHPVTPMAESDLARHLAKQTVLRLGLVDFTAMKRGAAEAQLAAALAGAARIVSLDVLDGETLAEAVTRELREETGMEGVCGPLIGWTELVPDSDVEHHLVILDFEVSLLDAAEPVAASDALDARWVPVGDVAEMRLAPGLAEFLHDHGIIPTFA